MTRPTFDDLPSVVAANRPAPLRRVVMQTRRNRYAEADPRWRDGDYGETADLTLECGHVVTGNWQHSFRFPDNGTVPDPFPRRRRCNECKRERSEGGIHDTTDNR